MTVLSITVFVVAYALIDKLIEMANTAGTGAKGRLRRPSGGRWKLFVHWSQITDLYSDETFQAQHLAAIAGADKREGLFKETKHLLTHALKNISQPEQ